MRKAVLRKLTAILILFYFLVLIYWMFFGFGRSYYPVVPYNYNLTPFSTVMLYILNYNSFNPKTWIINTLGNIGVFIPFGICIPFIFRWGLTKLLIFFMIGIATLELLQMLSRRGSFDVDDIILNSVGVIVGFMILKIIKKVAFSRS